MFSPTAMVTTVINGEARIKGEQRDLDPQVACWKELSRKLPDPQKTFYGQEKNKAIYTKP